jgi:hypothetical protein
MKGAIVSTCATCGRPAHLCCAVCGRTNCQACLDEDERVCKQCQAAAKKGSHPLVAGPPSRKVRPPVHRGAP